VGRTLWRWIAIVPFLALAALPPLTAAAPAGLDEGVHDLTSQIVPEVQKLGKKRIAVVDFVQLDGGVSDLGRYLAEELSAGLVLADGSLHIVDRQHLARIIAEQKLSVIGVTELGNVQRLGQLAGADVLVTGSITGLDESIRITVKLLSTATAQIVGAAQTSVFYDADVRTLAPDLSRGRSPAPPRAALSPAEPPAPGGTATLADVRAVGSEPDLYDFSYVTKRVTIGGHELRGGLVVFPSNGHANITYDLGARYQSFNAAIGVPDVVPSSVRMVFRAFVDGRLALPGRTLRAGDPPVPVTIAVTGAHTLLLDVEVDGVPADGQTVVSALWAEPRLVSAR
jgi:TolB-like protein